MKQLIKGFQISFLALALLGLALLTFALDGKPASSRYNTLNFGVIPWTDASVLKDFHGRFLTYLSEQIGIEVVLNIAPDYASLQKDIAMNNIQIAAFPAGAYGDALISIPNKIRYLATKWHNNYFYQGYIFCLQKTPYQSLEEMRGGTIAFTDPGSSSGYKYPIAHLLRREINPDIFFKKIFFVGSHSNVLNGVHNRRIEFGATYDKAFDAYQQKHRNPFRILVSYKIPFGAYTASTALPDELFNKIRKALVRLNDQTRLKNGTLVLKDRKFLSGFIVKSDKIYANVISTIQLIRKYQKSIASRQGSKK